MSFFPHPLRLSLAGGTSVLALLAAPAFAQTEDILLQPIVITQRDGTSIQSDDPADTGLVTLGEESVRARADTSGDAVSVLKTLPTVQYKNNLDDDQGENEVDALNLQPVEFSISGGGTTSNNIMIDGIGINSATGNSEPYRNNASSLSRVDTVGWTPQAIYGLHSQSQYIPAELLDKAEVFDSNVSAEFGGFTGGAVNFKLRKPKVGKEGGKVNFLFSGSDLVDYKLGTEGGINPLGVEKPEYSKFSFGISQDWTLNDSTAVLLAYTTTRAFADEEMQPQYTDRSQFENDTQKDFYRLALVHERGQDTFGLALNYTDYAQTWINPYREDFVLDVATRGLMVTADHSRDWAGAEFLGQNISNMRLTTTLGYQDNESGNESNNNVSYVWSGSKSNFLADPFDWCVGTEGTTVNCYTGGYGDTLFNDKKLALDTKLAGDIWAGSFNLGAAVEYSKVTRTGSGYVNYSAVRTAGPYDCAIGDPTCREDQYFWQKSQLDAYDVAVDAARFNTYAELDQTFGRLQLRGGLRGDWNEVLGNFDVAPRFAATWMQTEDLSFTFGANRYYSGEYLTYAIHDAMARPQSFTREGPQDEWVPRNPADPYSYSQNGLTTPYSDELTVAANYRDGWDGRWRFKVVERMGHDGFARGADSTTTQNKLTNEGSSEFRGITLEYENGWEEPGFGGLDFISVYASAAHSKNWASNNTYFGSDAVLVPEERISYNGKIYNRQDFREVTGNLDIPVRGTFEIRGAWLDRRVAVGLSGDYALGYTGVIDTGETDDGAFIYEDRDFGAELSANLATDIRLARVDGNDLMLNLTISNVFDNRKNVVVTDKNPWSAGRQAAIGLSYEW